MKKFKNALEENKLAVLIDGDNAQPSSIEYILHEVVKYGVITIRRIYGDWTTPQMDSWKKHLLLNAIQPIQQFRNTTGKNATDSAMIIDAMDILFTRNVESFVLVSSDSDYTRLCIRLREEGKVVIGIGKKQTPKSFVNSCNIFKYVENIIDEHKNLKIRNDQENIETESNIINNSDDHLISLLTEAYLMVEEESEWVDLRKIANNLKKLDPAFDPRTYGFPKLSKLFASYSEAFEQKRDTEKKKIFINKK